MEKLREVGRPVVRVDAYDKVTGRAKFTDDLCPKPCLEAKIYHATIGNGRVVSIDTSEAEKVPGVVAVFTCFDVPDICATRQTASCLTTACASMATTSP